MDKLTKMPDFPYTNEYGVVFTKKIVDKTIKFGFNCIKKYFKSDPAESGLEITEALIQTINNTTFEGAIKTYFYKALYFKRVNTYNQEKQFTSKHTSLDDYTDFAGASPYPLQESLEIQEFIMNLDPELASITKYLFQGYSYRDIAAKEGISKSEIGNRVNEIRTVWKHTHGGE